MKIIYDEAKAVKKSKRELAWIAIRIATLAVGIVLSITGLALNNSLLGITGGALMITTYIPSFFSPFSRIPLRSAKDSDVAYLKLSKTYKILEVKVEERIFETKKKKIPYLTVNFIAENKEGIVDNVFTGILEERRSAKVEEDTVDLRKGVLYKPYIPKESSEV